jgi:aspartyl/asparaginyl-tRNA synthetase
MYHEDLQAVLEKYLASLILHIKSSRTKELIVHTPEDTSTIETELVQWKRCQYHQGISFLKQILLTSGCI